MLGGAGRKPGVMRCFIFLTRGSANPGKLQNSLGARLQPLTSLHLTSCPMPCHFPAPFCDSAFKHPLCGAKVGLSISGVMKTWVLSSTGQTACHAYMPSRVWMASKAAGCPASLWPCCFPHTGGSVSPPCIWAAWLMCIRTCLFFFFYLVLVPRELSHLLLWPIAAHAGSCWSTCWLFRDMNRLKENT